MKKVLKKLVVGEIVFSIILGGIVMFKIDPPDPGAKIDPPDPASIQIPV